VGFPFSPVGFLGGFNAAVLLPLVLVLHYAGVENLTALTVKIFFFIVMKGLFDNVLSDMLWARSIMLTSPTVATVGAWCALLILAQCIQQSMWRCFRVVAHHPVVIVCGLDCET
jgi:hypothetical protein